jgi:hypothetical protein
MAQGSPAVTESLFGQLVRARHWNNYQGFLAQFHRTARMVADRDCDPRLATLTVSETTFKRWLAGQVRTQPRPDVARVLEALFEQPAGSLFRPRAAGIGEAAFTGAHHGTETQIRMAAERALKFSALILGDELSSDVIQHLHAEAARLSAATTRDPLPALLTGLANLQDISLSLLHRQHRPDQLRDLYMIAALASGLMAWASMDAGDYEAGMTQARTGLSCAQRAGHTGLAARITSWQVLSAYTGTGQARQAVSYSQHAASLGAKGYVSVYVPAMEARAHAVLGDRDATLNAITRAREAADQYRATDLDAYGGVFAFRANRQASFIAQAHVLLDSSSRAAATAADEAVALMADVPSQDRFSVGDALASTQQAITRAASGDLDAAQQSLTPVIELPSPHLTHLLVLNLTRLHSHVRARASQSPGLARDLQEQIEQFAQVGPPSQIR